MRDIGVSRTCGAVAATGTLLIACASIASAWSSQIVPAFRDERADTVLTSLVVTFLTAWQVWTVIALVTDRAGAAKTGCRSAIANGAVAVVAVGLFGTGHGPGVPFSAFASVWLGQYPSGAVLFPPLLLIQWFFLSWADFGSSDPRRPWRGVAIACIAYSAVLGVWVFSPFYEGWAFFTTVPITFFNIGVAIHLVAILALIREWRYDWALAALVGFGCLVSGLILVNQPFDPHSFGPIDSGAPIREIGSILKFGWTDLTNHLAPTAYVLTAGASIALSRLRASSRGRARSTSLQAGSSPTPSSG
ncbi:MAG TPA: hypothetical protein VHE55_19110 [Fimbriimonadaceae bacterium]|nr:hypothetical protein [Fimbriimonadaceae bacterium]